ncbi:MAG: 3-hydroxyacyl-CoA dehydrogenase/enoyl-CoA hydratase family protein [Nitrolancea sp.]
MRIRKVGVVGAGTMGAAIAALAASSGLPVVLLDVPGIPDRNAVVKNGLDRALKSRPASFMDPARSSLIQIGNTDDDLHLLRGCDWVVEAIIEQAAPKRALFERLDGLLDNTTIVTTNTSGIPIASLVTGRSKGFRSRFFGSHFFNPPRYLHLLEIIPTEETDPSLLETIESFGRSVLGKGTVRAKDVPGFIANRLGVYGMVRAIHLMQEHDLTIDEVDALTGPLIGRPRSAIFRTADLTGIDVLVHVADGLAESTGEDFELPDWVHGMVSEGRLGEKSGVGFYRRQDGAILTLDWKTNEYRPRADLRLSEIGAIKDRPLTERLAGALDLPGKYGAFMRGLVADNVVYTLNSASKIAYEIVDIDRAMEWGFGWELGPFKQIDALGIDRLAELIESSVESVPANLNVASGGFYSQSDSGNKQLEFGGGYGPVKPIPDALSLAELRRSGKVIKESSDATLFDLGDGVALVEFHTKMNAIGDGVLRMIDGALKWVEQNDYAGLVIGNEHERAFSSGANVALMLALAQEGAWDDLEMAARSFQRATTSLRYAPFPVVVAPFGLTLGGGAEFALHSDRVRANAELYMGLVETGVGIIPAGGGTKEMLFRFSNDLIAYPEADPFEALRRAFMLIAMAQTSQSALEARNFGFLRPQDQISMNRDALLADAKRAVIDMAPGYVAPFPRTVHVLGREAIGNLRYAVWSMHEGGQITDHEVMIASELAYVMCGGDGLPHEATEAEILGLEREAFLKLIGTRKSQERMAHMLKTGKPLRN